MFARSATFDGAALYGGHCDVAHQQVVLLTDDQHLAETVKSVRGNVVPLTVAHTVAAHAAPCSRP